MPTSFPVELAGARGAVTARLYASTSAAPEAFLVLAHGAGADQSHAWMVALAGALATRAVAVTTFNFPYMEAGRRAPDTPDVLQACFRAVVARVRGDLGGDARLCIGGKSLGGRMASHLAAAQEPGVVGLVCLGYPLHPPGKPHQLRIVHLARIRVPVLIVQGARDTFGAPEELRPHLAKIHAPVALHVVEEGDHSFKQPKKLAPDPLVTLGRVADAVVAFVRHACQVGSDEWAPRSARPEAKTPRSAS